MSNLHPLAQVHLVGHQDAGELARPALKRGSGIGGQRVAASSRAPGAGGVPAPRVQSREPLCLRSAGSAYAPLAPPGRGVLTMLCGGCSTSCIRCIQLRHASKVYGRAGSYTSTIAAPPWRVSVRVSTARQASTPRPSTTCSPTHQRPRPPRCWAHLPQAGKHLGEEVLSAGVEEVQLDAHIRVGDGHLLRAELGAARHLVRLRELRSRRVEHLHQGRLAHGWVAGLCSQGTRNHEEAQGGG